MLENMVDLPSKPLCRHHRHHKVFLDSDFYNNRLYSCRSMVEDQRERDIKPTILNWAMRLIQGQEFFHMPKNLVFAMENCLDLNKLNSSLGFLNTCIWILRFILVLRLNSKRHFQK